MVAFTEPLEIAQRVFSAFTETDDMVAFLTRYIAAFLETSRAEGLLFCKVGIAALELSASDALYSWPRMSHLS